MKKNIFYVGIGTIILLLSALIMNFFHIPNHTVVLIVGIILFLLVELPLYLVSLNQDKATKRIYNFFAFLFFFIFIISVFFALQHLFFPKKIAIILAIVSGTFLIYFIINELINKRLSVKKISFIHIYIIFLICMIVNLPFQMQAPDYGFHPRIESPVYEKGGGPNILIDGGHNNFHSLDGRLISTGELLKNDGYNVLNLSGKINLNKLNECEILVIVNALNEKNQDWKKPIFSAFTEKEISYISNWVYGGGSLLLIADHMPFPGAINDLANNFGFDFENGHAMDTIGDPDYFYRNKKTLNDNCITNGRNRNEKIDSILTFSGSAFKIPDDAYSILEFDSTWVTKNPDIAWEFEKVKAIPISGFSQGAFKEFGKGRVAVYGEAMMFTAQLGAGLSWVKIGMNSNMCPQNYQLLLNTMHWLDGLITFSLN